MSGTSTRRRRGSMAISNDFELDDDIIRKYRQAKVQVQDDDSMDSDSISVTDRLQNNSKNATHRFCFCCSAKAFLILLLGCLGLSIIFLCKNADLLKFDNMATWMKMKALPRCNNVNDNEEPFQLTTRKTSNQIKSFEEHVVKGNIGVYKANHVSSIGHLDDEAATVSGKGMTISESMNRQGMPENAAAAVLPLRANEHKVLSQNNRNVKATDVDTSSQSQHVSPKRRTMKLSLIGERNSGTTWTHQHLANCFDHALDVQPSLVRFKHWFQEDVLPEERLKPTVVVAQFRDPYYWVEAMRTRAYHSPYHRKISNWTDYVTKPWTMPRLAQDVYYRNMTLRMNTTNVHNESDIMCQDHFRYDQIISCTNFPYEYHSAHEDKDLDLDAISHIKDTVRYEMHQDGPHRGEPYKNILKLRRDKILNFLSVAQWDFVNELIPVKYEDLLSNGTASLIHHVERATGVKAKPSCRPKDPQTSRAKRPLDTDYVAYMTQNVDWETEALVGYFPRAYAGLNRGSTAKKSLHGEGKMPKTEQKVVGSTKVKRTRSMKNVRKIKGGKKAKALK